jgi:hypothetical protein
MGVVERCVSLWIGERMGPVERACLRSVMRQGHPVSLYCYRPVDGVPEGVELRDAAAILGEDRMIRHRTGSVALFANWFRYELLRRGAGIWLDTDIYLLAPLADQPCHLFGWEDETHLGNAVLRLPPDSPILADLIALFDRQDVPFWLSRRERLKARWRRWRTGRTGLPLMPWGTAGPRAITALARKHGKVLEAAKPSRFYPVHYRDAGWIRDPSHRIEALAQPDTLAVHLWNELIKGWKDAPAPAGSFLARLHTEGR